MLRTLCLVFQNRDCAQLGPPPQGEEVKVRWTDGLVYGAKFVASRAIYMYLVRCCYRVCWFSVTSQSLNSCY